MSTSRTGTLQPYWTVTAPEMRFGRLERSLNVDVVVIGAGITGVSTAYGLAKAGRRVALLDAGAIGAGETGRTTAHLTYALDGGYRDVERMHGTAKARLVLESHEAAIDLVEATVKEEGIDCGFERVDGYLFPHPKDRSRALEEELHALRRIGVHEPNFTDAPPRALSARPALRYPGQAQIHPLLYIEGLVNGLVRMKGQVFSDTAVQKIGPDGVLTRQGFKVHAHDVVVATHSPIKNVLFFLKEAAYRTYVVAYRIPKGSVPAALYWDSGDPESGQHAYHYVRIHREASADVLIVGGEDHKTGQQDDYEAPFANLERWSRETFSVREGQADFRWSGQVIEPVDSLAYIGRSPYHKERLYIATGYSGNGITYGAVAAMVLRDLILKKKSEWSALYNPTRKNLRSAMTFLEENMNVFSQYATDRFQKDEADAEKLAAGEGAVVQKGIGKVAAYRDESGEIFECSATCTHLGCVVQWNSAEKTFDCPCHGSRFTAKGEVITGPATRDLKKISGVRAS